MKRLAALILVGLFFCASAASDSADAPQATSYGTEAITIPQMLSYQGRLTDTLGQPVPDGNYPMMFLLYTVASGGSSFWSENQSMTTRDGLFSVLLGSSTPISSVPEAGTVYLAMTVSGGPELTPRIRIVSSAFAYLSGRASSADLLQGKDTTALDGRYVNEGQSGSVTSAMVLDGTIAAADLSPMNAGMGQVLKWNGTAWSPANDSVGQSSGGTVRKVQQATGVICSPNPIIDSGTVRFDSTWGDGRFVNEGQANSVSSTMIADGQVTSADIRDTTVNTADLKDGAVTSAKIGLPYSGSVGTADTAFKVVNTATGNSAPAICGRHDTVEYSGVGVVGVGGNTGVYGCVTRTGSNYYYGVAGNVSGSGGGYFFGVNGSADGTGSKYGLFGLATGTGTNYGIYSTASGSGTNYAGYFLGNVAVTGTLSKGGGSFQIDHPLDPQNKYLLHSFVESPDMMNIYNGNVKSDAKGYATVTLPNWFEALNGDFRYQLTVIDEEDGGSFAHAKVVRGVRDNSFVIRTSEPQTTVSWQVTGVRRDRFANANRIKVEVEKRGSERGRYIHPELYGQPREAGIGAPPEDPKAEKTRQWR